MLRTVLALALLVPAAASAQTGSDLWLLALEEGPSGQPVNLTARPGYDNQPHFTPDGAAILYTRIDSTEQADIYSFDLASGTHTPLTRTPESEYSPTPLPGGSGFSTVRVEADGTQRLWQFSPEDERPALVLETVQPVGYHVWADETTLLLFVLGEPHTLQLVDGPSERADTLAYDIGRALHRVPEAAGGGLSFVQKGDPGPWRVMRLDPATGALATVAPTRPEREDLAWLPDGRLLMADGRQVFVWLPEAAHWALFHDLSGVDGLGDITRLAVSPDGRLLALVAAEE